MNNLDLIVVLTSFISTISFAYVYYKLVGISKLFNKFSFLIYLLGVIFIYLIQYFHLEILGHISFFIFYPLLFYVMKPQPFKKLIFYVVIIWLYGSMLDFLAMIIISLSRIFFNFDVYNIYFECALSFYVFIMLVIVSNTRKLREMTDNLYKKIAQISYSNVAIIAFSLFTFMVGVILFLNVGNLTINLLLFIMLLVFIVAFIILFKVKEIENENKIFLETLKANNQFYFDIEDENRIFRHNINAKLLSIKSVSNHKAKLLIEDMLKEINKNKKVNIKMKEIPYGLNGIVYQKIYGCNLKIKIDNNIKYDIFGVLSPKRYNVLVEKIVIALDNAIESALRSKKQLLIISFYEENDKIVVEIKNSFTGSLNIDEIGKKSYSTKGSRRGLGLFSALRNNEVNLELKLINDLFIAKISTKKNYVH